MHDPIAYTYEADTHCPRCTAARFGREVREDGGSYPWPPADVQDSEGNPIGAIAPWDEWCYGEDGPCALSCGTCGDIIREHGRHVPDPMPDDDDPDPFRIAPVGTLRGDDAVWCLYPGCLGPADGSECRHPIGGE